MFRNHKTNVIAKNNIRHYSYVLDHDTGYAPNPFWGCMTLATCKPCLEKKGGFRSFARKDSWIVGTGGSKLYLERFEYYNGKLKDISPEKNINNKRLVFAFKVGEVVDTFEKYFNDPRFECKKISLNENEPIKRSGDNHLSDRGEGSNPIKYNNNNPLDSGKEKFAWVESVLVSNVNNFYYFGCFAPVLPEKLRAIINKGRNCKKFDNDKAELLEAFLLNVTGGKKGIFGFPSFKNEKRYREEANDVLYLKAIYNEYLKGVVSDKELRKLIECKEMKNSSLRKIFEG